MRLLRSFLRLGVIVGPLPITLVNNTVADAAPVMANFQWIVDQVNLNGAGITSVNHGGGDLPTNVAYGNNALAGNASGNDNVAIGSNALAANTTGTANTAIGFEALVANLTGLNNIAIGTQAMVANVSGNTNLAIGVLALSSNLTTGQNVAIGQQSLFLATSTQNVGCGYFSLASVTTGANNSAFGYFAGGVNATGSNNTYVGFQTNANAVNLNNSVALGANALITASNTIVLGDGAITNIRCQVQVINALSDARHKRDVKDLMLGLPFINRLRPVEYRFDNGDPTLRWGFIAQEVEAALPTREHGMAQGTINEPHLEFLCRENNDERTMLLAYISLIAPLVKAVKELSAELDAVKSRLGNR
jgi:hypothetical protein